jgi:hypothetical protein
MYKTCQDDSPSISPESQVHLNAQNSAEPPAHHPSCPQPGCLFLFPEYRFVLPRKFVSASSSISSRVLQISAPPRRSRFHLKCVKRKAAAILLDSFATGRDTRDLGLELLSLNVGVYVQRGIFEKSENVYLNSQRPPRARLYEIAVCAITPDRVVVSCG